MTTRRPRSNNPQQTPRAGAGSSAPRSVDASAYSRSAYGSRGSSRVAASGLGSQQARSARSGGSVRSSRTFMQPGSAQVMPSPSSSARPNGRPGNPASTTSLAPRSASDIAQYSRNGGNYGNGAQNNGKKRKSVNDTKKRMSKGTKIGIAVLLVLLAVLVGGVIGFYKFISSVNSELAGGKSEEEIMAIQDSLVPLSATPSLPRARSLAPTSRKSTRLPLSPVIASTPSSILRGLTSQRSASSTRIRSRSSIPTTPRSTASPTASG